MSAKLLRAGFAWDAASGIGAIAAILALCLGRMLTGTFGQAAGSLAGVSALFGAAVGLLALRSRLPALARPARTGALALVVAGALTASAPQWIAALGSLSAGLNGYVAALGFMLPLALLGASLAVALALLVQWHDGRGIRTSAALLVGATLGIALTLWLWPMWGSTLLLLAAGGVALLVALVLLIFEEREESPSPHMPTLDATHWLLGLGVFAMAIAVRGWLRLLGAMVGTHLLTTSVVLGTTLCMAALGIGVGVLVARRTKSAPGALGALLSLSAVATMLSVLVLEGLPVALVRSGTSPWRICSTVLLALGPPALLWGACLPVALRRAQSSYVTSLIPMAIGAGMGALVPLVWFAADHVLIAAGLLAMLAVVLQFVGARPGRAPRALLYGLPLVLLAIPAINEPLRARDWVPAVVATRAPRPHGLRLADEEDVRIYTDWFGARPESEFAGPRATAWFATQEAGGWLVARGWVWSSHDARRLGRAAGLLGVLLAPNAKRALVAEDPALAWWVVRQEVARVDAVRSDGVLNAVAPRESTEGVRWIRGAVLDHLEPETYDLIVAGGGPQWRPDVAMQATTDAWARGRAALQPGGVWIQPLPTMDGVDLPRVLATFRTVFPTLWVFRFGRDLVLVGFTSEPVLDFDHWKRVLDPDRPDDDESFRRPADLWRHFAADGRSLGAALEDLDPIEANDPAVELAAAWARWDDRNAPDLGFLAGSFPPDFGAFDRKRLGPWMDGALRGWTAAGEARIARAWESAWPYAARTETLETRAVIALELGDLKTAGTMARMLRKQEPDNMELVSLEVRALVRAARLGPGVRAKTRAEMDKIAAEHPKDGRVLAIVAAGMNGVGAPARAEALYEQALKIEGTKAAPPGTQAALGRLMLTGVSDEARDARAIALLRNDPKTYDDVESLDLLARSLSLSGDKQADMVERALESLSEARGREHLMFARRHLRHGAWSDAAAAAHAATDAWPGSLDCWLVRAVALDALRNDPATPDLARWEAQTARAVVEAQIANRTDEPAAKERARRILGWFGTRKDAAVQPRR